MAPPLSCSGVTSRTGYFSSDWNLTSPSMWTKTRGRLLKKTSWSSCALTSSKLRSSCFIMPQPSRKSIGRLYTVDAFNSRRQQLVSTRKVYPSQQKEISLWVKVSWWCKKSLAIHWVRDRRASCDSVLISQRSWSQAPWWYSERKVSKAWDMSLVSFQMPYSR